jgi:hypothetical protein
MGAYLFTATVAGLVSSTGVANVNISQPLAIRLEMISTPSQTPTYINVTVRCAPDDSITPIFETTVRRAHTQTDRQTGEALRQQESARHQAECRPA